jgi:hypothetical protein
LFKKKNEIIKVKLTNFTNQRINKQQVIVRNCRSIIKHDIEPVWTRNESWDNIGLSYTIVVGVGEPTLFKPNVEVCLVEHNCKSLFTRDTRWLFTYHRRDSGINLWLTLINKSDCIQNEEVFTKDNKELK